MTPASPRRPDPVALMRDLPAPPLDRAVLQETWALTCDRPRWSASTGRWARVAAVVLVAAAGAAAWWGTATASARAEEAHLAAIDDDLRLVMTHVGRVLVRAEQVAVDDALIGGAAPQLRAAFVPWPDPDPDSSRRRAPGGTP